MDAKHVFSSTTPVEVGGIVLSRSVKIDGVVHSADVRVTRIIETRQIDRPEWLAADSEGGRQYPLTETTYEAEIVDARVARFPAGELGRHLVNLANGD